MQTNDKDKLNFARSLIEGNINSFEMFYQTEYDNLCYFVSSFITHNRQQVEDIVQESFLAFWTSRHGLDPSRNIRAYLNTIAKNKTINTHKFLSRFQRITTKQAQVDLEIKTLESEEMTSRIDSLEMERIIDKTYDILEGRV
ncbi:MAG: hypothetical protein LBP96_04630, partial [Bacteroidales bacterium]|nr:hypothetical protein [Bacteroidales bacterium]